MSTSTSRSTFLVAAVSAGVGAAVVAGAYLLTRQQAQTSQPSPKSRSKQLATERRAAARQQRLDQEQQARVMERVGKFLDEKEQPSRETVDALFTEVAGEDGQISMSEFAMVVRAPLLYNVSQLVRNTLETAALTISRESGLDTVNEGTMEMALKIQEEIPKIQAGIPALSNAVFKALDKDASGYLDATEFQAALSLFDCFRDPDWVNGKPTPSNLNKMRPAFDLLFNAADVDNSGRLDVNDAKAVLHSASDFMFGIATSVVNLVSGSVSGAVLNKLVAQPFKEALTNMDQDGDGAIDLQEMQLEEKMGKIISTLRGGVVNPLESKGMHLAQAPLFAQDMLQEQVVMDIVTGVKGAENQLSLADKAKAGLSGGINETTFVKCCVAAVQHQQEDSLALIEETLAQSEAAPALAKVVRKLHSTVNPGSTNFRKIGLASAQQKIYSAIYALCDMNSDGVISWGEVEAWQEIQKAVTGHPDADQSKCAKAIFSIMDKNGDGEISLGEVEFLAQKLGVFGAAMAEGALEVAQVVVRAGIDLIGDTDYQELMHQMLADDNRLTAEERQDLEEAFKGDASLRVPQDPSQRTGDRKDMIALDGQARGGLTVDQAWALLMAAWPGARQAAQEEEDRASRRGVV